VGEKRMVRIEQVGRTAASARLLDGPDGGAPSGDARGKGDRRRSGPTLTAGNGHAEKRSRSRARGRRTGDTEDAQARSEAGLSEEPTAMDAEPEQEPAAVEETPAPAEAGDDNGIQSKPRRRGRRGGRRRSAARAKAGSE
jgi:hypothetical protein